MDRRKFLIGMGALTAGGAAALGTGAFSRVESQRDVVIQVAEDPDAYLGLSGTGSANSDNYVYIDGKGHLSIDIGENPNGGLGVNSDSFTWFDSMVQVCNQGKEAAGFYIHELSDDDFPDGIDATGPEPYADEPRLMFYTGTAAGSQGDAGIESVMGKDNAIVIDVGECIELGLRTMTKSVSAKDHDQLFGDEVTLIADVDTSGRPAVPAEDFITMGRIRDGGTGWQLAIADPTGAGVPGDIAVNDSSPDWEPEIDEEYSFEFSFDGVDTYTLTVEDEAGDEMSSVQADGLGVATAGSQFRLRLRGDAGGAVDFLGGELNGATLAPMHDDANDWPTQTIATVDLSQAFTVTGDFIFEGVSADERPAIDIMIEEQ